MGETEDLQVEIGERGRKRRLYRPRKVRVCDTYVSDRIRFIVLGDSGTIRLNQYFYLIQKPNRICRGVVSCQVSEMCVVTSKERAL